MEPVQVVAGIVLVGSLAAPVFAEADVSQVAKDHLAMAASYEEKATVQEALVAEHTAMKRDYKRRFYVNDKVTPLLKVQKTEAHCDAIIKAAQAEATELRSARSFRGARSVIRPREETTQPERFMVESVRIEVSHRVPIIPASSWWVTGIVFPNVRRNCSSTYAMRCSTGACAKQMASAMRRIR